MRTNLAICVPFSGRYVPPEWALSLACMMPPMNCNYCYLTIKSGQRDENRNTLVRRALERGVRFILFLDDDTAPPNHTIHKLMYELENSDDDVAVCAGIYCTKTDPPAPIVLTEEGGGPHWRWRVNDVFPCIGIGTGCMMIKAEVFSRISEPWFRDVKSITEGRELGLVSEDEDLIKFEMTDDLFFLRKVREAGYKILAHGGVLPIHWDDQGHYYVLPEGSYPVRNMQPNVPGVQVAGWMTEPELQWLSTTAAAMESAVEVGAWKGRSTRALAAARKLTVVDHWKGSVGERLFPVEDADEAFREFQENTADLGNLKVLKMPSVEASHHFDDGSVDMVFLDAGHDYENVKADIAAWLPKTRRVLCGHDHSECWPGVIQAVSELVGPVEVCGTIWAKQLSA